MNSCVRTRPCKKNYIMSVKKCCLLLSSIIFFNKIKEISDFGMPVIK
jgi:hypothetical protein